MTRPDPIPGYNFVVRLLDAPTMVVSAVSSLLGGGQATVDAGFRECRGLEGTLQVVDQPEGGLNDRVRRFPTRMAWSPITLSRGVGLSPELWEWYADYASGNGRRRDGLIVLLNDARQPVMRWRFSRALPTRWTGPTLDATSNELAIERLELVHEGLRVQPGPGLFSPV